MNPHSKPRPLFFTPRSPWGRLPLKHARHSHMHASEDAPNALQRAGSWINNKIIQPIKNSEPFIGVNVEKVGAEPASTDVGLGFRFGKGENSTGENSQEETSDAINKSLHVNEVRTNKERLKGVSTAPKSPDQIRMEQGIADRAADQRRREDASYARFLASQNKPGNARP